MKPFHTSEKGVIVPVLKKMIYAHCPSRLQSSLQSQHSCNCSELHSFSCTSNPLILSASLMPHVLSSFTVTCLILAGAAIVQMAPAGKSKKFGEYADKEYANRLVSRAKSSSIGRIDVLFDVYRQKNIKASTKRR